MSPRLLRDALNAALRKLTFPWLTPHPTSTGKETGYFQKTIKDSDLYEMYKRNQLAHNIVYAVAHDALAGEFAFATARRGARFAAACTLFSAVKKAWRASCGIRGSAQGIPVCSSATIALSLRL